MKPIRIAFAALLASLGCGSGMAQDKVDTAAMEKLAASSLCVSCHAANRKLVGPSYESIAEKYSKDKDAVKTLSAKVIKGGSGVWGPVPMPPHAKLSQDDSEKLVKWILSIKPK